MGYIIKKQIVSLCVSPLDHFVFVDIYASRMSQCKIETPLIETISLECMKNMCLREATALSTELNFYFLSFFFFKWEGEADAISGIF